MKLFVRPCYGAVFYLTALFSINSASAQDVDLELVLAMDASGSISEHEYMLQLNGTADAFLDSNIQAAITSGPRGKIAVAIVLWSDAAFPKANSGWHILDDEASIIAFSNLVRKFNLTADNKMGANGGGTGIGAGVAEAIRLIRENNLNGERMVVDVSGDGIETDFWFTRKTIMMPDAKLLAEINNVTINGLPILTRDHPDLDQYYRENVIFGPGAFIEKATDFDDFSRAIRRKLFREIAQPIG
ncbi:MAG: DUF1194 domain-containing protein [Rhizobiaceae bacterium]|nr:DUF1194 domain-containing protein [Rhizobiaceae bacterium]